jgi:hypothetical protein
MKQVPRLVVERQLALQPKLELRYHPCAKIISHLETHRRLQLRWPKFEHVTRLADS